MATKQEIIADTSLFQRVCGAFVRKNVLYCMSALMYDIGQHLEESAKIFDEDYDTMLGWYQQDDWDEPVSYYISSLDRDEVVAYLEGRSIQCNDDEDVATLREAMLEDIRSEGALQDFANENNLDPHVTEVYEHWLIDSYFAEELKEAGEIIFEFENMTIWGRTTTGQSISMDYVIEHMVKELDEDHWVWREA